MELIFRLCGLEDTSFDQIKHDSYRIAEVDGGKYSNYGGTGALKHYGPSKSGASLLYIMIMMF